MKINLLYRWLAFVISMFSLGMFVTNMKEAVEVVMVSSIVFLVPSWREKDEG